MSANPAASSPGERPRTILIRATSETLPGSAMKVAGLTPIERAIRQWSRVPGASIVVLSDGSVPLPAADAARVSVQAAELVRDAPERFGAAPDDVVAANLVDPATRPRTGGAPVLVTDEASRARAEEAIFAEMVRGDLGLAARWLNKPISVRITRYLLCRLPVTPNQVTVGAALVGLLGCALIATGSYWPVVVGFLLAHLQSVLDGCDGELARARFQQSAIGEWLDTIADDALNLALLGALALALRNPARGGPPGGSWIAVVAGLMLLFYNVICYRELVRQGEGGEVLKVRWWFARGGNVKAMAGQSTKGLAAFLYNLGRRDVFVFVWFLFALADRLDLILYFAILVAGTSFVVAAGQVLSRTRSS